MICQRCSNPVANDATVCPICGAPLAQVVEPAPTPTPINGANPAAKKPSGVNLMIWGIIGMVLALWSAYIVFVGMIPSLGTLLSGLACGFFFYWPIVIAAFVISLVAVGQVRKYRKQFGAPNGMGRVGLILSNIALPVSIASLVGAILGLLLIIGFLVIDIIFYVVVNFFSLLF